MAHLDRDGVKIYYEDNGEGPPILLSHGYSATCEMWAGQVDALKGTHRIITWDMRGHGKSDSPDDPAAYSEAHTVGDMVALLEVCGVEKAIIAGLSLGGYMSLAFNLLHKDKVQALMLFDTGPGYKSDSARDEWNVFAEKRAVDFETDGLATLSKSRSDESRKASHTSAKGLALAARGMLAQRDSRVIESLSSVNVPTLVLVGENDEGFIAATNYMTKKIPGATQVVISGAGHAANLDNPDDFNAAVTVFLSGLTH